MILEIDYGNTRLKWRLLDCNTSICIARGAVIQVQEIQQAIVSHLYEPIHYCRVSSVRLACDNLELDSLIEDWFDVDVVYATSKESLAGVVNGYVEPAKLGVDRWLAIVAAYARMQKACVVFDCGTAFTADFINTTGVHLGGCIAPGLRLLSGTLLGNTGKLGSAVTDVSELGVLNCGVNTQSAIACGVSAMMSGFVKEQLLIAHQLLGVNFGVICTGGDASYIFKELNDTVVDEDLVFQGLAIACPFASGV